MPSRQISGKYGPQEHLALTVPEDNKEALFGLLVSQGLLGHVYSSGNGQAVEYWSRVKVDGRGEAFNHGFRNSMGEYYLCRDRDERMSVMLRLESFRTELKRLTAAEIFTKWAWDGGSAEGMTPFFQTYYVKMVRYAVPSLEEPTQDEFTWRQLTFRDDSCAYLERVMIANKSFVAASLKPSPRVQRYMEANRYLLRGQFTPALAPLA